MTVPVVAGDISVPLGRADSIKLSDQGEFQRILDRLDEASAALMLD